MINAQKLFLSFGEQKILDDVSFTITSTDRIGLVGRNGSGKSTLFKILAEEQGLDSGTISIEKNKTLAYVPQDIVLKSKETVFNEALSVFKDLFDLEEERKKLDKILENNSSPDANVVDRYAYVHNRLAELNINEAQIETKNILKGLGFSAEQMNQSVDSLSVGWKMRLFLTKLLLQKADFYLFDEPTNHLDLPTKDWLLDFLKRSRFGFLIVCHDRYFLDHLCDKIFELDRGRMFVYKGNFASYLEQKDKRNKELEHAYKLQQNEIKRKQATIERFRYSASKAKMAQKMIKELDKMDKIELDSENKNIKVNFGDVQRSGQTVLKVEDLAFSFGEKKIFQNVSFDINRGEKVAIVAPNGAGKTTLFNVICKKYKQSNGAISYGHKVTSAIFEQDQNKALDPNKTILEEVESSCSKQSLPFVRKFLGAFLFSGDDVEKKIKVLSGGEKNRVAMVKVLLERANFLMLDEPTNHLDIQSKEILLNTLKDFNGTILFVSHDRDFLNNLATRILELNSDGIESYTGNYDEYLYLKKERENLVGETSQDLKSDKPAFRSKPASGKEVFEKNKKIRSLENKIDKLEQEKSKYQKKLEEFDYGTDNYNKSYKCLLEIDEQLREFEVEWEKLIS